MAPKRLVAISNGRVMGHVEQDAHGQLRFVYDPSWPTFNLAHPLSLSMPLSVAEHPHRAIFPFLSGLLPDNRAVRKRWAESYGGSPRNPFSLLWHRLGEDCAGAVQFVNPDRLDEIRPFIQWVESADVAAQLRFLRTDPAAPRIPGDPRRFSLAGMRPKTALIHRNVRWGVSVGHIATTHILKTPVDDFPRILENEHICLRLAAAVGLPVVDSRIERFEDETAIAIARFDRATLALKLFRLHQEDMCQALAIVPEKNYEGGGGPGVAQVVELLQTHSTNAEADVNTFIGALIFNWLIGGIDGHAKNYSLHLRPHRNFRLAPLYDLTSILPYANRGGRFDLRQTGFAMKIGGEYIVDRVGPAQWATMAATLGLDRNALFHRLIDMAERFPDVMRAVAGQAVDDGLDQSFTQLLAELIVDRARRCLDRLRVVI
jgi:serine/threonine-protein kinase HipA